MAPKTEVAEQRLVYGEVYAPNRPDVHGEYMTAEDIQQMAHEFMRLLRQQSVDQQHDHVLTPGITVVESFIARKGDPDFLEGAWVVCVHVNDDDTWQKVKDGKLNGFSVEALVRKKEVDVQIKIPEEVTGETSEVDDHKHTFKVNYDKKGKLVGGRTNTVKGHWHGISGGTITDVASGHRHRFSSVDGLEIVEVPPEGAE